MTVRKFSAFNPIARRSLAMVIYDSGDANNYGPSTNTYDSNPYSSKCVIDTTLSPRPRLATMRTTCVRAESYRSRSSIRYQIIAERPVINPSLQI